MKLSVAQILEMPYKGKELSMLIFLPKEMKDDTTGLEKVVITKHTQTHTHICTLTHVIVDVVSITAGEAADL